MKVPDGHSIEYEVDLEVVRRMLERARYRRRRRRGVTSDLFDFY